MTPEKQLTVVIAEDEYLISLDVAECARSAGFDVIGVASDGEQALQLMQERLPDVVILDIKMPRMDGLEAARQIRDRFAVPVVIMTAYESSDLLQQVKEAGVGAYLTKPPSAQAIQRAVEISVARHEDMMALRRANAELREALGRIKTLEGIIPICMYCRRIRTERSDWVQVEKYVSEHTDAAFSHGVCPECVARRFDLE